MASANSPVTVMEVSQITPPLDFPQSATQLTLPLTFFDTFWFKFHPVERIFFYELTADSSFFNSAILSNLKQSLSLALLHFLPLAGKLVWPSNSSKPFILYTPNDGVSVTVAESDADFHHLSGERIRESAHSRDYIPELSVSDEKAATVAFQITFFPNKGFSIGVSSHHAILDGKSIIMFLKAWAHKCKHIQKHNSNPSLPLPLELTPVFDRTIIQDPEGKEMNFLNNWLSFASKIGMNAHPRSLELIPMSPPNIKMVRGTFELSGEDVRKLRQKVISQLGEGHLSTFVITYAYVAFTIVKTKGLDRNRKLYMGFMVDCRSRLDPPLPANYFGNCVFPHGITTEAGFVMGENGLAFLANEFNEAIKQMEKAGVLDGAKEKVNQYTSIVPGSIELFGIAGSHRFEVYGIDFGWGRPKLVEITSIDRTGAISMAESKNRDGGVEVGLVLTQHHMEIFDSLFVNGLEDL